MPANQTTQFHAGEPATVGGAVLAHLASRWNAAAAIWNPDELAGLYAEDALFFGGRMSHFTGRDGARAYFESYRDMLSGVALSLRDQRIVPVSSTSLLAQGFADIHFTLVGGRRTCGTFRTTWLLHCIGGAEWQIKAHHFSPVPEVLPIPT